MIKNAFFLPEIRDDSHPKYNFVFRNKYHIVNIFYPPLSALISAFDVFFESVGVLYILKSERNCCFSVLIDIVVCSYFISSSSELLLNIFLCLRTLPAELAYIFLCFV